MAEIRGKGILYKNQYGWSISQVKKDKNGKQEIFFIPVKVIQNALNRAIDRKFIEFEGFTNHYKTKDGKTMTDFVITHIFDKEFSLQKEASETINGYVYNPTVGVVAENEVRDKSIENGSLLDVTGDDLPF